MTASYHAHVYYSGEERAAAAVLRERLLATRDAAPRLSYVGRLADAPVGPHPIAQFEIHFDAPARDAVIGLLESSGLTALVHPLTDDDLADHTDHARWIGAPLDLDLSALDPPGENRGAERFGKADV
ncbi:MAG TPA: DOPA 4,5-dioxygenase family protein [Novosphingobium sp.]|nr:DOPA 4,5-dioxygenase family protein [Novosphingobium sp.]